MNAAPAPLERFPVVLGITVGAALVIVLITGAVASAAAAIVPLYAVVSTSVRWFLPREGVLAALRGAMTLAVFFGTLAVTDAWWTPIGVVVLAAIIERFAIPPVIQPDAPAAFRPQRRH